MDGAPAAEPVSGDDLPIDSALIKVLAADSRRDILRLLKQRRMTLTELAGQLDLKKATVLEHLKRLTDAGLVRRMEDERLWVYYELTRQGLRIVNPGRTRFYLLMGATAAAGLLVGGLVVAALVLQAPHVLDVGQGSDHVPQSPPAATDGVGSTTGSSASGQPTPPEIGLRLQAPASAWRGLDGDITFHVTRTGAPASGDLVLEPTLADGSRALTLSADASTGNATLASFQLDSLSPQRYDVVLSSASSNVTTLGAFDIRSPPITVEPFWTVEGVPTTFVVHAPSDKAPTVLLGGAPVTTSRTSSTTLAFRASPSAGATDVSVGRLYHQSVSALPNATIDVGAWDGAAWSVRVLRDGAPASGATVAFGPMASQVTDASGAARLAPTNGAAQTLRITFADGASIARDLSVDANAVHPLAPAFELVTFRATATPSGVDARAELVEANRLGGDVGVTLLVDGAPVASRLLHVQAGATQATVANFLAMPELADGRHDAQLALDAPPLLRFTRDGATLGAPAPADTNATTTANDASSGARGSSNVAVFFVGATPTPSAPTVTTSATSSSYPSAGAPAKVPAPSIALVLAAALGAIAFAARANRGDRK